MRDQMETTNPKEAAAGDAANMCPGAGIDAAGGMNEAALARFYQAYDPELLDDRKGVTGFAKSLKGLPRRLLIRKA